MLEFDLEVNITGLLVLQYIFVSKNENKILKVCIYQNSAENSFCPKFHNFLVKCGIFSSADMIDYRKIKHELKYNFKNTFLVLLGLIWGSALSTWIKLLPYTPKAGETSKVKK